MQNEMDNSDGPEKVAQIDPLLEISRKRMDEIVSSFEAAKQVALHSSTNYFTKPSVPEDRGFLLSIGNASNSKDVGPKYDPQLMMFRRMVCSEDLTKDRLIPRKENMKNAINTNVVEEEGDEAFFEKLKNRISQDIQDKMRNKTHLPLPRRSSTVNKRKSPFNEECLNLMKKCRSQMIKNHSEPSSVIQNGIFSLSNSENQESLQMQFIAKNNDIAPVEQKTPINIPNQQLGKSPKKYFNSEDDDDFPCKTPFLVRSADDELET